MMPPLPASPFRRLPRGGLLCGALVASLLTLALPAYAAPTHVVPAKPAAPQAGAGPRTGIVAVVNGEVVSMADVDHRRRLFALSTGLPVTDELLARLTPQVTTQLIDERLRLQEIQRRHVTVSDKEIAEAITDIETRNGMQPGALRARLATQGVELRTMIDQVRVQIGWGRVLREVMADNVKISDTDIDQQEALMKAQIGQTEYRVGEIFVPISDPAKAEDARRFADTVIGQLRAGASFAVVAAQFSQSQTALSGGDRGWVQKDELDPAVLRVVNEMPAGAISNPIAVPGGYSIVTLRGKREIGREPATLVRVRQVFYHFQGRLDPANPTPQQRQAVENARKASASIKDCAGMEELAKANGDVKGGDPGEVRLETVGVPALRQLMSTMPLEKVSQPLIADDGVALMMICSRDSKNLGLPSRKDLSDRLLNERVELASRQLMRDLQRKAVIDRRVG